MKNKDCLIYNLDYREALSKIKVPVDLILTDPPFGISYSNNFTHQRYKVLQGDDKGHFSYQLFSEILFPKLKVARSLITFTCPTEFGDHCNEIRCAGFTISGPLVVQKRPSGKTDLFGSFQSNADWLIHATKGRFKFQPTTLLKNKKAGQIPNVGRKPVPQFKTRMPNHWFGLEYPYSTENPSSGIKHPTAKTVELCRWLILLTTLPGDTVVDPFMGSGTTGIACKLTGRKFIGCEIDPTYFILAKERLNHA